MRVCECVCVCVRVRVRVCRSEETSLPLNYLPSSLPPFLLPSSLPPSFPPSLPPRWSKSPRLMRSWMPSWSTIDSVLTFWRAYTPPSSTALLRLPPALLARGSPNLSFSPGIDCLPIKHPWAKLRGWALTQQNTVQCIMWGDGWGGGGQ